MLTINLKTVETQDGRTIPSLALEIVADIDINGNPALRFAISKIECFNSEAYGLGTCLCNTHNAGTTEEVLQGVAEEILKKYLTNSARQTTNTPS